MESRETKPKRGIQFVQKTTMKATDYIGWSKKEKRRRESSGQTLLYAGCGRDKMKAQPRKL